MKLASRRSGRDGALIVVSKDTKPTVDASHIAPTMQAALDEAAKKDNFSLGMQSQAFVFRLAFYAVIGLIVALIVKKTNNKEA